MTIATLAYFRPSLVDMVVYHGAGRSRDALAADTKMWVALNWVRITAVVASLGMGVRALTLPKPQPAWHENAKLQASRSEQVARN